jgi:hypothetical protein
MNGVNSDRGDDNNDTMNELIMQKTPSHESRGKKKWVPIAPVETARGES